MARTTSLVNGAIITVMMRWFDRAVGVISTLILARILVPDDFGIIAMASVIVVFVDTLLDMGINVALIQRKDPTQEYYDSAWTLRILQASGVAIILGICAPFAADYYHDERVTDVIRLMALSIVIASFENVGVVNFQKELNFTADVKFVFFKRMVSFIATVSMTLLLESYWGMVLGTLCARTAGTLRSYWIHPMRPSFCIKEIRNIFGISQWLLVKNISQYLDRTTHIFVVGGMGNTSVTGGYTLASEISDIPGTDLLAPINRVLFPAFAQARDNLAELRRLLISAQGIQVMITFPACVGFVMTAREFVPVALGEKWIFIVPFIQILALSNIIQSISSSANYVLTVVGQIRLLALASWIHIILFGLGILAFSQALTPELVARLRLGAIVATFGVSYYLLTRHVEGISILAMLKGIVRPVCGCAAIVLSLHGLELYLALAPAWMLTLKVATGVAVYIVVVLSMWHLADRPEGAEAFLLKKILGNRIVPARAGAGTK